MDTFRQVFARLRFRPQLLKADNDRVQGWWRTRHYLAPNVGTDGRETAMLQILAGTCPELVRTLPGLIFDQHRAEDCDKKGEDHAPDALRYGLMSRPVPALPPKVNPPSDFTAEAAYKMVALRRRVTEKGYIGSEMMDPRFLNYRRRGLYSPDR